MSAYVVPHEVWCVTYETDFGDRESWCHPGCGGRCRHLDDRASIMECAESKVATFNRTMAAHPDWGALRAEIVIKRSRVPYPAGW